ncbi:siderophore-interacting protein [Kibdelosporangium aridum]|uniref:NADPH-dependent ferric siderophore reductase, contains FAD-binding and SIP domains n=1 Tax=Kibdelosporangium aridum TaxID=2030 RepID=A0A1Y5Y779_KIBAR|nr:siderophore-interacting protein [Kibdelosporangium aridum]SMD25769.1 NADPH-dependent ferric siderophore reductase, contains FAD-binding and SIP domains [Kibdelosporangium aridum]
MAERRGRKARTGVVSRVEQLTPHMVRVVLTGGDLAELSIGEYTDHYIKILFAPPGATYPEPFDVGAIRETMPAETWPVIRTYTIRRWVPEIPEMWVDFVVHGDAGVAGPWATQAKPGDLVRFMGPGGGYAPDAQADWHLLAGDESALPAIAAALEAMPSGAQVKAFIEVSDADEVQKLETPSDADIKWLYRADQPIGRQLVSAVRELDFPSGRLQAFVHGEANFVKELRRYLRVEREIPMSQLSISGYWRQGMNEDGWQSSKREWNQQVEAEQGA